ncbi:DUF6252 family protein [Flavobacterium cellulosilyticum]|uniref:Uncharacterized protein n=1 Tax=Flavobacterium cellulosilyticum TaxID=2541731 RepID=A0A4R5C5G7_9FLAO|nr:DUF6252 family protein [Flavobacterium cellulosilyticum]TDD93889.1 hypothetical protein E0F76_18055 [Flavobacterium cellulosilyticum]
MKNSLVYIYIFLTIIAPFFLNSCGSNEPVDSNFKNTNSGTTAGIFKVDIDGKTFVAASVQALVNDNYISISGLKTPSGEMVQITLPAPFNKVGTYSWKSVNGAGGIIGLVYIPTSGAAPYISSSKGSGGASDNIGYTDTASITITKIDIVNNKISGNFQFTGVKFKDLTGTSIETKILSNGSFTDVTFTKDIPVPITNNSFSAKLDGSVFSPVYIDALNSTGNINIIARRGTVETIGLSFLNTIAVGTYPLDSFIGNYKAGYIKNNNIDGSGIFSVNTGSITITSHDKINKKVAGTFKFSAISLIVSETHNITEGTFSVSY